MIMEEMKDYFTEFEDDDSDVEWLFSDFELALKNNYNHILDAEETVTDESKAEIYANEGGIMDNNCKNNENNPYYAWDISLLGFSQYLTNRLNAKGCNTVGDLAKMTVQDLREINGIGEKSCREIINKLKSIGITIVDLDIERKRSFPHNLLAALEGLDPRKIPIEEYDQDRLMGVSIALDTLREREKEVLILQYMYSLSDAYIGKYYRLSCDRIHQFHCKALRKLRHPRMYGLLKKGVKGYIIDKFPDKDSATVAMLYDCYMQGYNDGIVDNITKWEPYFSSSFQQAIEEINLPISALECLKHTAADRVIGRFDITRNKRLSRFLQNNNKEETNTVNAEMSTNQHPIEDLELSIRPFNCLKRAGINNVEDLLKLDLEAILKIRNLGLKSAAEIAEKLQQHNICNNVWESVLMIHQPIERLELPIRCFNCLKRSGVETVKDILNFDSVESIYEIRNLGRHGAQAIALTLQEHGLCIGPWASLL